MIEFFLFAVGCYVIYFVVAFFWTLMFRKKSPLDLEIDQALKESRDTRRDVDRHLKEYEKFLDRLNSGK